MPTSPALTPVLERLGRLRARVRTLLAATGVARLLAWAAALVLVWVLADVVLDLPLGVRRFVRSGLLTGPGDLSPLLYGLATAGALGAFVVALRHRSGLAGVFAFALAGVPGVLAWVLGHHLVAPLRVALPDEALALSVERSFASLKDRVAAALDFDRELAAPTRGESPAMMARVVEEAGREVEGLAFAKVASARALLRHGLAALGATAVLAGVAVAMPSTLGLWARRSLLLEDVAWPRATTLVAVVLDAAGHETEKDPATPYVAALGQPLTVLARARGRVPSEVEIVDRVVAPDGGGEPLSHRMRAAAEEGRFEHEFRDVRGDFTFVLRGGDDRDDAPEYRVVVRVPPRVTALRADLVYPAYLGLPPRRVEGGTLSVPEGTQVAVAFDCDPSVVRAEAFLDEAPVAVTREGPTARLRFEATKSLRYRLRIVTADGRENDAAADTYEVSVEPDTPPRPEWVWPRGPTEVTANGRVPLFAQTRDDHGVADLVLEVLPVAAAAPTRVPLAARTAADASGANDRPYGADAILSYVPLEVASVLDRDGKPLVAPTRFQVRVVAKDAKGQEAAGPWAAVDVLRPDEIERGFAAARARVKQDVEAVRGDVKALADLAAQLAASGTAAGESERQVLRDVQFRAGKSRTDLDRAARGVGALFTSYVYDRLGGQAPTEALLALFDRRHRATFSRATDARGAGAPDAPAVAADAETDVFPWALFREVVRARRDRLVFDTGVVDKMITVLERAVEAADERAPAALEAAATSARGGSPDELAALAETLSLWKTSLDATVAAMAEWQSLSELTLFLRRLIEEQEAIDRDLRRFK
ncbi:MAG: hypothetical protein IT460_14615 [Planctomycetes bacterium]|nr:hypothetical protein [Planctomycetota bacterium]